MRKVKKAIIPAGGLGIRFLPITKAMPKEMLPIVDVPVIQYLVQEAIESGIEEILIITNGSKSCMENHFDHSYELESRLRDAGKTQDLKVVEGIAEMANVYYVRQQEPRGLGHAVYCAKSFVEDEPFAVLLGDNLVHVEKNEEPALLQLIQQYEKVHTSVLGVQKVEDKDIHRYGIIEPAKKKMSDPRLIQLESIVEKPQAENAPSNMAVYGRYVFTPELFDVLYEMDEGGEREIHLTEAIKGLMETQTMYAYDFEGVRYDVGDRMGFLRANVDAALRRDDTKEAMAAYIKELAGKY